MRYMNRVVVKIGSHIITLDNGELNHKEIERIVSDVVNLRNRGDKKVLIVSSGAVSSGRINEGLRKNFRVDTSGETKQTTREQVLAAIGQPELMAFYKNEFAKYEVVCAQVLVTRYDFADRKRYLSLRTVIENLINLGIVPIVNENDVLSTEELDFSDNDQLACFLAAMLVVDRLVILTDVDGVYDVSHRSEKKELLSEISDIKAMLMKIGSSASNIGRGGMKSKLLAADLITSLGIPMHIASGFEANVVSRIVIDKERIGTMFPVTAKRVQPIKAWLKTSAASKGRIIISTYLADIMRRKQVASVLMSGIEGVEGIFDKNDVVSVYDEDGNIIGRGQCRYGSSRLREEILAYQVQRKELDRIEGGKKIAIHYDQFVYK